VSSFLKEVDLYRPSDCSTSHSRRSGTSDHTRSLQFYLQITP